MTDFRSCGGATPKSHPIQCQAMVGVLKNMSYFLLAIRTYYSSDYFLYFVLFFGSWQRDETLFIGSIDHDLSLKAINRQKWRWTIAISVKLSSSRNYEFHSLATIRLFLFLCSQRSFKHQQWKINQERERERASERKRDSYTPNDSYIHIYKLNNEDLSQINHIPCTHISS